MKILKSLAIASIASLMSIAAANAGSFDAYSMVDQKSKRLVLVVSFAGDGSVTDAQLDLDAPVGYKLVSAKSKVDGTICVGMTGNKIRIVPPTGAEKALAKSSTDYCTFSFVAEKGLNVASAPVFKQSFIECAALSGIKSCDANISDITQ